MKFVLALCLALATLTSAAVLPDPHHYENVPIVHQEHDVSIDGSYHHSYETGNGIVAEEHGVLKNAGTDAAAEEVQGSYSYTAPDGTPISVKYIANENGFQPEGAHLPVPSETIARSIKYNLEHAEPEEHQPRYHPVPTHPAYTTHGHGFHI
ncbi:unnamed protein product [Callosobruchus maculatus]|uniref:Uncharacterized protein n=1 Tax=Callosobruchus maculatus TaxID=64391 RepID=A0A653CRL9_CALMS|nr:unnamed protein product [Callosobruchus maculatus]